MMNRKRISSVLFLMVALIGVSSVASADMINNIAPEATASASSFYRAGFEATGINDGNTAWGSGTAWMSANTTPPHSVELTWDQAVQFDEVKVYGIGYLVDFADYDPYDFQIQTSDDGLAWVTVDDVTANTLPVYTFTSASPITAKHLRINVTTPMAIAGDLARITEVEVNGVPEPGTISLLAVGGLIALRRRRRK